MKKTYFITLCLISVLSSTFAWGMSDEQVVVKLSDRTGVDTFEVMTRKEFYALEKACRSDSAYAMKALMMAQRAWKEDDTNKGSFPRAAAMPVKVRALRGYRTLEEANEAAQRYVSQERESANKKDQSLKRKYTVQYRERGNGRNNNRTRSRLDTARYNEARQKDEERQEELKKACRLYDSMLEQCKQEAAERVTAAQTMEPADKE